MKIEKYKNLTFDELYNLKCFQNTPIIEFNSFNLIGYMNELINSLYDVFGEISENDKFYFHCFVLDELCYTSKQIIIFVTINKTDVIGALIMDFERGCEFLFYCQNDIAYDTLFELLNMGG